MNLWETDDYDGERISVFLDWETIDSLQQDCDGATIQLPKWALDRIIQTYQEEF